MDRPEIPCLHVCVTCQPEDAAPSTGQADGQVLHDALMALLRRRGTERVRVKPVICLANCDRGCAAAISASGKWSYLLGHLSPALAEDLLAYADQYARSKAGVVLASQRPTTLRNSIMGRFPAVDCA